jgi:hypothetical protein
MEGGGCRVAAFSTGSFQPKWTRTLRQPSSCASAGLKRSTVLSSDYNALARSNTTLDR